MRITQADAGLVLQSLNELADFLEYDPHRAEVAPSTDTLQNIRTRIREARANGYAEEPALTTDECAVLADFLHHIVQSLNMGEFAIRTGYSTDEALALRTRLLDIPN